MSVCCCSFRGAGPAPETSDHAWDHQASSCSCLASALTLLKVPTPARQSAPPCSRSDSLATSRKAFYRKNALSRRGSSPAGSLAIPRRHQCRRFWLASSLIEQYAYRAKLWWSFSVNGQTSRFPCALRAALPTEVVLLLGFSLWRWLQPAIAKGIPSDPRRSRHVEATILATAEFGYSDGRPSPCSASKSSFLMTAPSGQSSSCYGVRGRTGSR